MEKKNNSVGKTVLIVLLLIITIASLVLATYAWAKYTDSTTGTATGNVAKWNVTFASTENTVTSSQSHVIDGRIAPGTNGSFEIQIQPGSTEVCFDYEIEFTNVSNKPEHLVFYVEDAAGKIAPIYTSATSKTNIVGTYDPAVTAEKGQTITKTIYWAWPYTAPEGTDANEVTAWDAQDTKDGNNAAAGNQLMTVNYTITATQVQPEGEHKTASPAAGAYIAK